jgi:Zn-dependent M28 family amino/carboxypeptidase
MKIRTLALVVTGSVAVLGASLGLRGDAETVSQTVVALDSVRLLTTLSVLAHDSMEGRAAGTEGGARARRFLAGRLAEARIEPLGTNFDAAFELPEGRGTGVNLVALLPGAVSSPYIVLSAHYDHVGVRDGQIYNGADDNASGTAMALEIARVLRSEPAHHPVILVLFDAEEGGLRGARHFVAEPPVPLADIALNVNLDMVARAEGVLWAGGAFHTPALRPVLESVADRAPLALRLGHDRPDAPEGDDWTTQSDHGAFHAAGIPFVYFGVEDHPDYHRPTDDFEAVNPADFVGAARTVLAALRALDAALPLPPPEAPR